MAHLIKTHSRNVFGPEHIYVTRHGQSQGQLDIDQYRICGDDNIPLTDLGHVQAAHAGELLRAFNIHVAALYHSTSLRALQTGEGILLALPYTPDVVPDRRIDKQKFGQFDGLFTDAERQQACPEAFARYQEDLKLNGPLVARPPGGESILDVIDRVGRFLREAGKDGQPRIAVTHGLGVLSIEAILMGRSDDWLLAHQDTAGNTEVVHFYKGDGGRYHKEILDDAPAPALELAANGIS